MTTTTATWCPICSEHCLDHPSICTICGEALQDVPPRPSSHRNQTTHIVATTATGRFVVEDGGEIWQTPPAEAMDPQSQQQQQNILSTSKQFMEKLDRVTIHENSSILHQATISITIFYEKFESNEINRESVDNVLNKDESHTFQATISEFKPHAPYKVHGELHLSLPINGTKPMSIPTTIMSKTNPLSSSYILYMERGQNTFYQKIQNATTLSPQISGIICSNNNSTWPYTMKDSTGQANAANNTIPIVMVKQSDGNFIRSLLQKQQQQQCTIVTSISADKKSDDCNSCIICTDLYQVNDVIIQLPRCHHYFHEKCIIHWLESHNTCPFCRIELPLENDKEEEDRRRRMTSSDDRRYRNNNDYGDQRGNGSQWESIFG